jgi:ketosteroid isomerase-like protein
VTGDENTVRRLFAAIDSGDIACVLSLMTEDVAFRFGSAEPTTGKAAIADNAAGMARVVESLSHELDAVWTVEQPQPAVLCETAVTYRRHDGSQITLPCFNVFRLRRGRVADYRIYMDVNPVFVAEGV